MREYPDRMAHFDGITNIHIEMGDVCFKHGCFDCPPPPLALTTGQMCAPYRYSLHRPYIFSWHS